MQIRLPPTGTTGETLASLEFPKRKRRDLRMRGSGTAPTRPCNIVARLCHRFCSEG